MTVFDGWELLLQQVPKSQHYYSATVVYSFMCLLSERAERAVPCPACLIAFLSRAQHNQWLMST